MRIESGHNVASFLKWSHLSKRRVAGLLLICLLIMSSSVFALDPAEVAVIVNKSVGDSTDLAEYYMEKRGIPEENLVAIRTTSKENISRLDYVEEIAAPIRDALLERVAKGEIRALLLMYGVPLTVSQPENTRVEKRQIEALKDEQKTVSAGLKDEPDATVVKQFKERLAALDKELKALVRQNYRAAVDSELTLVMAESYPLADWILNPFFVGYQTGRANLQVTKDQVLMVARLDAPNPDMVRRMIDDSLFAEENGLRGKAYFDARYPRPEKTKKLGGSGFYDYSLHLAADKVRTKEFMPVILDDKQELFQEGDAPDAALYCGWYSLARYIDAFTWSRGAVGYHLASQECQTLRGNGSYWCKRMLEDGAAATIGPVAEPYLQAFPVPEIFFAYLTDGYYNLVESYYLSLPWLSWQMVLVGDPLYRPFMMENKKP